MADATTVPTRELAALRMGGSASDSEDHFDDEEETHEEVELGFVSKIDAPLDATLLHETSDWSAWDGGLVGGKPKWLSATGVPTSEQLACPECAAPLSFLLQIYCPLDDEPDAFHRSLYVLCCRKSGCSRQGSGKVFRMQLPQVNAQYPPTEGVEEFTSSVSSPPLCVLCGQRGVFKCSACKVAQYCSKEHQKDHWSHGHKQDCARCLESQKLIESDESRAALRSKGSKWVFPQYQVEIETEPDAGEAANEHEATLISEFERRTTQPAAAATSAQGEAAESDPFADDADFTVSQKDLNEALGAPQDQDKNYVRFLTRVELAKDQVLRYARWQEQSVLWVHSGETLDHADAVPACGRCGSPRKFEFQVLPQLLFYLQVDQASSLSQIAEKSCEWGTLVAYTCTQSCALLGEAAEEFLHYQPPYAGA